MFSIDKREQRPAKGSTRNDKENKHNRDKTNNVTSKSDFHRMEDCLTIVSHGRGFLLKNGRTFSHSLLNSLSAGDFMLSS